MREPQARTTERRPAEGPWLTTAGCADSRMPSTPSRCERRAMDTTHPVALAIDYPERPLNRLTTAFRPFVALPILIVLGTVSGGSIDWTRGDTARPSPRPAACSSSGRC